MERTKTQHFTSIENIIGLMKEELGKISPLRLQKTLYFLYAYYGASYGSMSESKEYELSGDERMNLPKYLFSGEFEAWQYGPVVRELYFKHKYDTLKDCSFDVNHIGIDDETMKKEVIEYLRELIRNTSEVSDFGLVERSHEDEEWQEKVKKQETMDNDNIIKEYKEVVNG